MFDDIANIGKSSMGWFFGFKLHITCNTNGELTSMAFTKASVDDRVPVLKLVSGFKGKIFADKGYISIKLAQQLDDMGITLITTPKKNMKARFMPANFVDIILHKKRSIIESIFNILKNKLNISHSRHRSIFNFIGHLLSTLIGYQFLCKKPKIKIDRALNNFA